jgi:hypothetical protein
VLRADLPDVRARAGAGFLGVALGAMVEFMTAGEIRDAHGVPRRPKTKRPSPLSLR